MHSHDRTMISQFVQDKDRKMPEHEMACRYLGSNPDIVKRIAVVCLQTSTVWGGLVSHADEGIEIDEDLPTIDHHVEDYRKILREPGVPHWTPKRINEEIKEYVSVFQKGRRITADRVEKDENFRSAYNLEFPINKGDGKYRTTVGFLDLRLMFGVSQEFQDDDGHWVVVAAVEVKTIPTLVSEVLRQINLYREIHQADFWVLATTYPVSKADRQVLANEKIIHIELGEAFRTWRREQDVVEDLTGEAPGLSQDAPAVASPAKTMATKLDHAEGVLGWLRCAKVGVKLVDGQPRLNFPDDPTIDREEVVEEVAKVRAEIVNLLEQGFRTYVPSLDDV